MSEKLRLELERATISVRPEMFHRVFSRAMERIDCTAEDLADVFNFPLTQVQSWLRGEDAPACETRKRILVFLCEEYDRSAEHADRA